MPPESVLTPDISRHEEEMDYGRCETTIGIFILGRWADKRRCANAAFTIIRVTCRCGHVFTRAICRKHARTSGWCRMCATEECAIPHLCAVSKSGL